MLAGLSDSSMYAPGCETLSSVSGDPFLYFKYAGKILLIQKYLVPTSHLLISIWECLLPSLDSSEKRILGQRGTVLTITTTELIKQWSIHILAHIPERNNPPWFPCLPILSSIWRPLLFLPIVATRKDYNGSMTLQLQYPSQLTNLTFIHSFNKYLLKALSSVAGNRDG